MRSLHYLFLQFLEFGPIKFIIPEDFNYFHYIDDVLFIYPWNNDLTKITDGLNTIEPTTDFTYERENNNTLPILDSLTVHITHIVNLASFVNDMIWWLSCRVLALQSVVTGSISSGGDHGIHC